MFFDPERLINRIKEAPGGSEVKIFVFIALNQPQDGIRGFETTKEQLAIDLNLKLPTIFKALRWLTENLFIQEIKQVQTVDFMVNPYFVMNNCDPKARIAEWNRRCDLYIQRKNRLRDAKRRRERKKSV